MTMPVISRIPNGTNEHTSETAHGVDSGHCRTLPWVSQRGDGACLYLGLKSSEPKMPPTAGAQASARVGDLVLLDALRPEHLLRSDEFVYFRIPCSYLQITKDEVLYLADVQVSGAGGIPALVSKFLAALIGEEALCRSIGGRQIALNAVDLVALLVEELLQPYRTEPSEGGGEMLTRIREYIEENLMDPDMSPESIARAHHISVRYLHKLFQNEGATVSTWVRKRRLESCRHDLGRLSNRRRTVAAVAQSWGFASPSHFSRIFRQAYGVSPSERQISASAEG
ncbi:helix-turn-helix transcriptional regulator [Streptomyces yaanensis]|uniref:Helix-turn-helix transcriptional regulator n=1 Tax=Streptomyces yaanensis TaxID=1142239 RepID=A0ABV7SM16_9ACTN|nr:helix-turn-helix transcriptional regulator [Streptomyces sp. CGMCC 4.7035]WNC01751.1 helix-turn-helix transcriptional regulator [Streptomyces sp. CGMCC 4.7035]